MQPRETITNLAITCAVILAVAVLALILKAGRPTPVAIPVAVSPVVKEDKTIVANDAEQAGRSLRKPSEKFLTFPNPDLVQGTSGEADSFQFRIGGEVLTFTLYFVDALDSSEAHPQRVGGQARFFGKATTAAITQTGQEAYAYVMNLLKTRAFHLLTRWEAQPNTDRYYALILVEYEKGNWTYLQDLLVRQGFARVDGITTPLPDDKRSVETYLSQLRDHARHAREKRLGIWARVKSP
ncbi:MAG: thermonuclease family protein [Verrucomicrobiaceae bacterium]|nr:thermonuclease family protein [Verrucomicrobiaceae bacterium]